MSEPGADTVDLLVIGAGAAGMAAALVAAVERLRVVVCEKAQQVGGTSAGHDAGSRPGLRLAGCDARRGERCP